jgi:hypothetical protein
MVTIVTHDATGATRAPVATQEVNMPKLPRKPGRQALEPRVSETVYRSAMTRATSQGQRLATVARTVLFQEAAKTPDGAPLPTQPLPRRARGETRLPIKFEVDADAYKVAKDKITASGRTVGAAIEDGLRTYARTGVLENLVPVDSISRETS